MLSDDQPRRPLRIRAPLTTEQCGFFATHGWLTAPQFFGVDETRENALWTEELLARPEAPGSH